MCVIIIAINILDLVMIFKWKFFRSIGKTAVPESTSPTVAIQTDPASARWGLDPQQGFTFPQQIIIPPSRGSTGPDGRPQPQTYRINSEIRISYDQHGKPVPHEVAALPREQPPQSTEQMPSMRQQTQVHIS